MATVRVIVPLLVSAGSFVPLARGEDIALAQALASPVRGQAHCTWNSNCTCDGCTAFREQQQKALTPPQVDEMPPFTPRTDVPDQPSTTDSGSDTPTTPPSTDPSSPFAPGTSDLGDALTPSPSTSGQLASAFGGSAGGYGPPSMIGDLFGGGLILSTTDIPGDPGASLPIAGGDRRQKFADNNSPIPRDRVLFDFNHYHNAVRDVQNIQTHANRYLFGFERTFFDQLTSVELRIPFTGGIDSTQDYLGTDTTGVEFGNISTTFKALLWRDRRQALAVGMMTILPTADDGEFTNTPGFGTLTFDNGSVHLAPFIGYVFTPNNLGFHQIFTQLDFDTGGYDVAFDNSLSGTIQEQTLMFLSYSYARWLYRSPEGILRGIAPMLELHYTTTIEDVDPGPLAGVVMDNRRDILNLMAGLHLLIGNGTVIRIGGGAPLRDDTDREFDAELALQVIQYF